MIAGGSQQEPEFQVGEAASLEPLRLAIRTAKISGGGEDAISIALKELLGESRNEKVLMSLTPVILSLQKAPSSPPHGEYDDDDDDDLVKGDINKDGNENISEKGKHGLRKDFRFQKIEGNLIMTTKRFLFISNESQGQEQEQHLQEESKNYDLSIDAECIHLHAQSEDPEPSIYLQIVEGDDDDDDDQYPTEVTITPISQSNDEKIRICEKLFSKFSELLSLNPISPNDYGDQQHAVGGMMMMEMMGTAMGQQNGLNMVAADDAASSDDEMIIAAPAVGVGAINGEPHQFSDCEEEEATQGQQYHKQHIKKRSRETEDGNDNDNDPGATPEERAAMLERLDSILVVKPGLEVRDDALAEDQFAGAEDPIIT